MITKEMIEAGAKFLRENDDIMSWSELAEGALTAALSSQWRGMESAPRDGTPILGYIPESTRQVVRELRWAKDYEGDPGYWTSAPGVSGRGYSFLPENVTKWMSLPPPPATQE